MTENQTDHVPLDIEAENEQERRYRIESEPITVGISPKVTWPVVALVALGALLVVVGALIANDTVLTVGVTLIGAVIPVGAVGWRAPAGEIIR